MFSYEKLWEKESTFVYRITEKSLWKIPTLRGDVQEQMEDGFGEAVLNILGADRTACYSGEVF